MALYTVMDFEATSKYPTSAQPLSFSYVTFEGKDFFTPIDSGTLFFWKEGTVITEENFAIHGLSKEFLEPYAKEYEQNCRRLFKITQRGNLIGQNIKTYDIPLLNNFLRREGYPNLTKDTVIDPESISDLRYYLGSSHDQKTMLELIEAEREDIMDYWLKLFPNSVFKEDEVVKHNGEFDVVGSLFLFVDAVFKKKFSVR